MTIYACKEELLSAIKNYEALFSERRPMPAHREDDVAQLRQMINQDHMENQLCSLLCEIKAYLMTMRTGIWLCVFNPGHSRLKNRVNKVIKKYDTPLVTELSFEDLSLSQALYELSETDSDSEKEKSPANDEAYQAKQGLSPSKVHKRRSV